MEPALFIVRRLPGFPPECFLYIPVLSGRVSPDYLSKVTDTPAPNETEEVTETPSPTTAEDNETSQETTAGWCKNPVIWILITVVLAGLLLVYNKKKKDQK